MPPSWPALWGCRRVGGVRGLLDAMQSGDELVMDADEGQVILRPEAEVRDHYLRARDAREARRAGYGTLRRLPSETADGTPFSLMLNVGLALELEQLDAVGAAGIGLFRTEIAMMARGLVVDTAEQAALYGRVLDAAGRPAGAVPHARSWRRQAAARRTARRGGEPGDGLALAARGAGPAGVAAPPGQGAAAGRGRPAAIHHVSDGRHRRRVPRRPRLAVCRSRPACARRQAG